MAIINDMKPRGIDLAYSQLPFDQGKVELEKAGYRVISLEENARLRIQEGKSADVSRSGNWVREDFLYVPKRDKVIFTKNSPIMKHAIEATQANRDGKEFYVDEQEVQKALGDSIDVSYSQKPIPTKRFGENEITVFAFGDEKKAQEYGAFLKEAGISEMPLWIVDNKYVNEQENFFVRKLWFRYLGNWSVLDGDNRYLYCDYRVRGVRGVCEANEPQKNLGNVTRYTLEDIEKALKESGFSGAKKGLLEKLGK